MRYIKEKVPLQCSKYGEFPECEECHHADPHYFCLSVECPCIDEGHTNIVECNYEEEATTYDE